jgi:hypothetical protein
METSMKFRRLAIIALLGGIGISAAACQPTPDKVLPSTDTTDTVPWTSPDYSPVTTDTVPWTSPDYSPDAGSSTNHCAFYGDIECPNTPIVVPGPDLSSWD